MKQISVFLSVLYVIVGILFYFFKRENIRTNILDIIFVPYLSTKVMSKKYIFLCYKGKMLTILYIYQRHN